MTNQELARLEYLKYSGHQIESPVLSNQHRLVAVKPVCEVLRLDYMTQYSGLGKDKYLLNYRVSYPTVASDGKVRKMVCLPARQIGIWIHGVSDKG